MCPFRCPDVNFSPSSMPENSDILTSLGRFAAEFQVTGTPPDKSKVSSVATDLERAHSGWMGLLSTMSSSRDFQAREYYTMCVRHVERKGSSLPDISAGILWQVSAMRAFAAGLPPPLPPPSVQRAMEQQSASPSGFPDLTMGDFSAEPFDASALAASPLVAQEFRQLRADHKSLLDLGARSTRLELDNLVKKEFKEETEAFLSKMTLDVSGFEELLEETHAAMRKEASS
ncbi:hypothetical protein TeGR_g14956 [Tetraparma gracilis]|uniref:Uncharacterized protein n=1 Tax=Tetraparma gracilis TaxID=2962635 RepID=A0ABQ6MRA9_9STRA|nr:hypothetical protein TeGR_g14956 [Tetraparma gracilis]